MKLLNEIVCDMSQIITKKQRKSWELTAKKC